ncbi:MAG: hypothetical protein M5U13_18135 [Thermoanaerobaculia bacterium]|nr:hypothetical protein [Thermoanaerobaculia bacterium]
MPATLTQERECPAELVAHREPFADRAARIRDRLEDRAFHEPSQAPPPRTPVSEAEDPDHRRDPTRWILDLLVAFDEEE